MQWLRLGGVAWRAVFCDGSRARVCDARVAIPFFCSHNAGVALKVRITLEIDCVSPRADVRNVCINGDDQFSRTL